MDISKGNLICCIQHHVPPDDEKLNFFRYNIENLNFILISRNIVKSLDSMFYHHCYESKWAYHKKNFYLYYIEEAFQSLGVFFGYYFNLSNIIKFEDLHSNPKETMNNFCKIYNINFNKNMLDETFLGKKISFKSQGFIRSGSDKNRVEDLKLKCFSNIDRNIINFLFNDINKKIYKNFTSNNKLKFNLPSKLIILSFFNEYRIFWKDYSMLKKYEYFNFFSKLIFLISKIILFPNLIYKVFSFKKGILDLKKKNNYLNNIKFEKII